MALLVLGAAGTLQLNSTASGTEQTAILAGLDTAGVLRAVAVDSSGRLATTDSSDVLSSPASHARQALDASGKFVLAANSVRVYVEVQNCLATDMVMKLSATAPTSMADGDLMTRGMSWSGFYSGPISFFGNGGAAAAAAVSVKYWTSS